MRYAVLLAVAVGMAAGQSIEFTNGQEQCGWWWPYDVATHEVGVAHRAGGCQWFSPEPTRYYLAWGLGDDATAQLGPQDIRKERNCKAIGYHTTTCDVPPTLPSPEPLEVPAIHHESIPIEHLEDCPGMVGTRGDGVRLCQPLKEWTCKDTTNALLTAEDGTKWCHKIQKQ